MTRRDEHISEKTRKKMRLAKLGKKLSPEHRNSVISALRKRHPFLGRHHTIETKKKLSLIFKGQRLSEEIKQKMKLSHLGKKLSDEHRKNIRLSKLGDKNPNWLGGDVGMDGIHFWIRRNYKMPKLCQMCKKVPPYDLANISGEYLRDINDWQWLCRRCHMISDGRLDRLHKKRK